MTVRDTTAAIRALNDSFRSTFTGGLVVVSKTFRKLPAATKAQVLKKVREAPTFFEERDYDLTLQVHSPDPANPRVTRRVLTVGLSSEDL